ncbi:MAG: hypothetical protein ACLRIL_09345 [Fusicatenibacter saccharivorans]
MTIARLAAKRMIKHMNEPQKQGGEGVTAFREIILPGFCRRETERD